jgi:fatty acid desaturase
MTVDRFDQRVRDYTAEIRALERDQQAVSFRGPEYVEIQKQIDAVVAAKRQFERNVPTLRRGDRSVTLRLVLVLLGVIAVVGALIAFGALSPWFLALEFVLGLLVYGVLATPR